MISIFYDHIEEAVKQTGKSTEEVLGIIKDAGYEAVTIRASSIYNKEDEIKRLFDHAGFKISSIYEWFDFGTQGDPTPGYCLIDLANRMNVKKVLVIPGFIRIKWKLIRKMTMHNMAETLKKLVSYGKSKDVMITLEDFDDYTAPYSSSLELQWFLDQVPDLKITFDTGNFLYQEEDELEAFTLLQNNIAHVHLKDRSFTEVEGEDYKSTLKGRKMYSSPVGKGVIQMEEILKRLKEQGYTGDFTVEHFGSLNQLEDMLDSVAFLKEQNL
jgi:L-ribulose-5-phosphate 3-epimerase